MAYNFQGMTGFKSILMLSELSSEFNYKEEKIWIIGLLNSSLRALKMGKTFFVSVMVLNL
jgi:hypothetical protein